MLQNVRSAQYFTMYKLLLPIYLLASSSACFSSAILTKTPKEQHSFTTQNRPSHPTFLPSLFHPYLSYTKHYISDQWILRAIVGASDSVPPLFSIHLVVFLFIHVSRVVSAPTKTIWCTNGFSFAGLWRQTVRRRHASGWRRGPDFGDAS